MAATSENRARGLALRDVGFALSDAGRHGDALTPLAGAALLLAQPDGAPELCLHINLRRATALFLLERDRELLHLTEPMLVSSMQQVGPDGVAGVRSMRFVALSRLRQWSDARAEASAFLVAVGERADGKFRDLAVDAYATRAQASRELDQLGLALESAELGLAAAWRVPRDRRDGAWRDTLARVMLERAAALDLQGNKTEASEAYGCFIREFRAQLNVRSQSAVLMARRRRMGLWLTALRAAP